MTVKTNTIGSFKFMPTENEFGLRKSYMPFYASDNDGDGGNNDGGQQQQPTAEEIAAEKIAKEEASKQSKPTDAEAKLLKEVMAKNKKLQEVKDQMKRFENIDVEKYQAMLDNEAKLEEERKQSEIDKARAAGDFEKLKKMMADENKRLLDDKDKEVNATKQRMSGYEKQIRELTVGAAFYSSKFVNDDIVLPADIARTAYDTYFEVEDGKIVPYDGPRSDDTRNPLVDNSGNPLKFDEAIKRIVEASPNKDKILRSQRSNGSGTGNRNLPNNSNPNTSAPRTATDRITEGLKNLSRK